MPSVKIAKSAGFCFGVQRAVKTVYDCAERAEKEKKPIYTFGPIIHNTQVVADLAEKGVRVLEEKDLDQSFPKGGYVVIRSHGVSEEVLKKIESTGLEVIDATCPFVKKIHNIVREQSAAGRHILIVGNPDHPEVIGIRGWVRGTCDVIRDADDLKKLNLIQGTKICIVAQTTFNHDKFQELVEIAGSLVYDENILNTICNATRERQEEADRLASEVDVMLVVGSRESSNTQKLYEICRAECKNTYYIQTLEDLVAVHFPSDSLVGITAGASTPNNIIQEVSQYVGRT